MLLQNPQLAYALLQAQVVMRIVDPEIDSDLELFSSEKCNMQEAFKAITGTFLGVSWLRIHLPMQETLVPSLVQEGSTCRRATKPMCHNS